MLTQSETEKDLAAGIIPAIVPKAPWRVSEVKALDNYRLHVRFLDGVQGTVRMSDLIHSPQAGVFSILADVGLFNQVGLEHGAVTWPGKLDLAPDAMYDAIKATGEWILR
jgi:hypothetical protein